MGAKTVFIVSTIYSKFKDTDAYNRIDISDGDEIWEVYDEKNLRLGFGFNCVHFSLYDRLWKDSG